MNLHITPSFNISVKQPLFYFFLFLNICGWLDAIITVSTISFFSTRVSGLMPETTSESSCIRLLPSFLYTPTWSASLPTSPWTSAHTHQVSHHQHGTRITSVVEHALRNYNGCFSNGNCLLQVILGTVINTKLANLCHTLQTDLTDLADKATV